MKPRAPRAPPLRADAEPFFPLAEHPWHGDHEPRVLPGDNSLPNLAAALAHSRGSSVPLLRAAGVLRFCPDGHPDKEWLVGVAESGLRTIDPVIAADVDLPRSVSEPNYFKATAAHSALSVTRIITKGDLSELRLHRYVRVPVEVLHTVNPRGCVDKPNGKLRRPGPSGASVNDINVPHAVRLVSTDDIVSGLDAARRRLGAGNVFMAKADLFAAYRCLVNADAIYAGILLSDGSYAVDTRLSFGLRSAVALFTHFTNVVRDMIWAECQRRHPDLFGDARPDDFFCAARSPSSALTADDILRVYIDDFFAYGSKAEVDASCRSCASSSRSSDS